MIIIQAIHKGYKAILHELNSEHVLFACTELDNIDFEGLKNYMPYAEVLYIKV